MEQMIEFAGNHLYLFAAFALVSILLAQNIFAGMDRSSVDSGAATTLINREDAVVVDVRPMSEFSSGHILGSINIPINGLKNQLGQLDKHKNKPVIVSCRSGSQSQAACRDLRKSGFEQTYNLRGGIMAWQSANLPLSKEK